MGQRAGERAGRGGAVAGVPLASGAAALLRVPSGTQRDHVIYESRLELAVLLLADFDPSVRGILAQPFLLRAQVGGMTRKHIPDYLLLTGSGPVVVDVKPRHRLARPEVAQTFGWTRTLVEARGWRYEVRCEPPPERLENVRFLAGYRLPAGVAVRPGTAGAAACGRP